MSLFLGVDTGGTYTDAVLIENETRVVAFAKALTTRHDLAIGIGQAMDAVLTGIKPEQISLVSLSTTLATNALVEGQGGRVCLILIGFEPQDMARAGLAQALQGDPVVSVAGGHTHSGSESAALDLVRLRAGIMQHVGYVGAFAVAGHFAVRNPAHEVAARDLVRELTGKPVTCSHELTARLNGPKRALTAVLNARLIGLIGRLVEASEGLLVARKINAPLMVVRGDGALVSAEFARMRPIETILSGPAASIVGAVWLTKAQNAIVSDIGGTTTDVAVLRDGRPKIDAEGAMVGGHRTMVEAVAMRTTGLGGDSEVWLMETGLVAKLHLGPKRRVPLALLAMDWPDLVHSVLDAQLAQERPGEAAGQFVLPVLRIGRNLSGLSERERGLIDRLGGRAMALADLIRARVEIAALERLVARGLVQIAAFTPSDAAHVLGKQTGWDRAAAEKGAQLFARQRNGAGEVIAANAEGMSAQVIAQLSKQTCEILLETAFAEDGLEHPEKLARHVLSVLGMAGHNGAARVAVGLALPLIGLGASAPIYYGNVAKTLGCEAILPEHAGVANAIGAVVGQVRQKVRVALTCPTEGRYRVHLPGGPQDFAELAAALDVAEVAASQAAQAGAVLAGAGQVQVTVTQALNRVNVEGRDVLVDAEVEALAFGRPAIAGV